MAAINILYAPATLDAEEMINMNMPRCCGEKMRMGVDTGKFLEVVCARCGDIVYLKKNVTQKPQMVDD